MLEVCQKAVGFYLPKFKSLYVSWILITEPFSDTSAIENFQFESLDTGWMEPQNPVTAVWKDIFAQIAVFSLYWLDSFQVIDQ